MIDKYARNIISHSLNTIYEGKTISYFVEKLNDNDLLYYGKNEELNMITDPKILLFWRNIYILKILLIEIQEKLFNYIKRKKNNKLLIKLFIY